jgi:saccharopine dehydrogenase-like NADP-dependent oxidoreductase
MKNAPTILVVGASGTLGKLICREVLRIFGQTVTLLVGDYNSERGTALATSLGEQAEFRYINAVESDSIIKALQGASCVIVAMNQTHPLIQLHCVEASVHCIDVAASAELLEQVRQFHDKAVAQNVTLAMYSGFFPGLSGMLVQQMTTEFSQIDEVNVGLLFSANAQAGFSGILQMIEIFHQPVNIVVHGLKTSMPGFQRVKRLDFPEPFGPKRVRLVNYSEREVLATSRGHWAYSDRKSRRLTR